MATYVVGDVHGCFDSLSALLAQMPLDPARDRLWLTGDLVNRGPRSLEVLRWAERIAATMGQRFACVLGNHDLRLLAVAAGARPARPRDTLDRVLAAPDAAALIAWLGRLPLVVRHRGWLLVHAGLPPKWQPAKAERRARRAETLLAGPAAVRLLSRRPGEGLAEDAPGGGDVDEEARAAAALDAFTQLRVVDRRGRAYDFSGPLADLPAGCTPWFRAWRQQAGRRHPEVEVIFGHWSALGLYRADGVLGLDTGCVWGGALTAVRLDDGTVYRQPVVEPAAELPGG